MKANELMIGDWVDFYKSPFADPHYYRKVTYLDRYDLICNPIPLTAEILEKNGWVRESDGQTWYDGIHNEEQVYVYCPIRRNGNVRKIEICSIRHHYSAELASKYYVHELQHALRLCGLTNLADNFIV